MHHQRYRTIAILIILVGALALGMIQPVSASLDQQTTVVVPTVTGTPTGVIVTVNSENDQINVRSGPNTTYEKIGVLLAGQQVQAKGKSPKGEWVLVYYPGVPGDEGWVYSYSLIIPAGSNLPVVETPPDPTPANSPTVDPTLASQFIVTAEPTRLPTFTESAPLVVPTLSSSSSSGDSSIPMGMVVLGLGSLGILLGLVSLIRGR